MQDRTADLLRARQALSQLSYSPFISARVFLLLIRYHVICVDTRETSLIKETFPLKLFYFKIRR